MEWGARTTLWGDSHEGRDMGTPPSPESPPKLHPHPIGIIRPRLL